MNLEQMKSADYYLGNLLIIILRPISLFLGVILRRDHSSEIQKSVFVFKLLGGGSVVSAYPALIAIKTRYPNKKLNLICTPAVKGFADVMNCFDRIYVLETSSVRRIVVTATQCLLAAFRADCILNFELHSRLSGVFSLLSCARNRFGFFMVWSRWQYGLTTHAFFYNGIAPIYQAYDQMAEELGGHVDQRYECVRRFRMQFKSELPLSVLRATGRSICLSPFCSELGPERMFTAKEWIYIIEHKYPREELAIYLLGGKVDVESAKNYEREFLSLAPNLKIINVAGKLSLKESVAVLHEVGELLTIDSGLNHIARLLGLKITSYWGPTDPSTRLAPYPFDQPEQIHYRKVYCSPCIHVADYAPCKGQNICMQRHLDRQVDLPRSGWINTHLDEGFKL